MKKTICALGLALLCSSPIFAEENEPISLPPLDAVEDWNAAHPVTYTAVAYADIKMSADYAKK